MCWVTNVRIAPVQDASSLRIASSFCTSSCNRVNRCSKRSFSPLCSREYVPATFFTRISSAGKITCNHQQKKKNLIPQMFCASRQAYSWPINLHKYTDLWALKSTINPSMIKTCIVRALNNWCNRPSISLYGRMKQER